MWALARPVLLGVACLGVVIIGYLSYRALGTDLLPEMDQGAFVLDYLTRAGTSLKRIVCCFMWSRFCTIRPR